MWIRNQRLINYLKDNGLLPTTDLLEEAYFTKSELLDDLIFKYNIFYGCIPNKGRIPKRRFYNCHY